MEGVRTMNEQGLLGFVFIAFLGDSEGIGIFRRNCRVKKRSSIL